MLNYRYDLQKLLSALENTGGLDLFVADIFRFNLLCEENFGVQEVLFNEHVVPDSKREYFHKVCDEALGADFKSFVLRLIENNDLPLYELISRKFIELIGRTKNGVFAEVLSAVDLNAEQQTALRQELERLTGQKVYLRNIVSKNVLGGLIIKCGDKVLDWSVQNSLAQLKTALV